MSTIVTDASDYKPWVARKGNIQGITITCVDSNGAAFNLSSYSFVAELWRFGAGEAFLTATTVNGGVTGIITISFSASQLNIAPSKDYYWILRTTAPTAQVWFNGPFTLNSALWDGTPTTSITDTVSLGTTNIIATITLTGSSSSSGAAWGGITGTLSSQTDLQSALNAKQASGSYAVTTNNLSDLSNASTARTNLGLGTAATHPATDFETAGAAAAALVTAEAYTDIVGNLKLAKANNLSDLANAGTARTNLGLGTLATQSGTFSGTSSGTNTGDQTITLTGDVTGSGSGSFATTIKSSVALAGSPTTTTQSANDNSTKIATTAYTDGALAAKANLASPTFTGTPTLPTGTIATTQSSSDNSTKVATTAFVQSLIGTSWIKVTALTGDQNITSTTPADITGLSFTPVANTLYEIITYIIYDSANTGEGAGFGINGPTLTSLKYFTQRTTGATAVSNRQGTSAYDTDVASTTSLASNNWSNGYAQIKCSSASTPIIMRMFCETGAFQITVKAGSYIMYRAV